MIMNLICNTCTSDFCGENEACNDYCYGCKYKCPPYNESKNCHYVCKRNSKKLLNNKHKHFFYR